VFSIRMHTQIHGIMMGMGIVMGRRHFLINSQFTNFTIHDVFTLPIGLLDPRNGG